MATSEARLDFMPIRLHPVSFPGFRRTNRPRAPKREKLLRDMTEAKMAFTRTDLALRKARGKADPRLLRERDGKKKKWKGAEEAWEKENQQTYQHQVEEAEKNGADGKALRLRLDYKEKVRQRAGDTVRGRGQDHDDVSGDWKDGKYTKNSALREKRKHTRLPLIFQHLPKVRKRLS